MAMEVPGKRRRGRPKRRWLDSIRNDLSERELSREDTQDRDKWRRLVCPYPVSVLVVFLSCRKMSHPLLCEYGGVAIVGSALATTR